MSLVEKEPPFEELTLDIRKGDKGEVINVYFTIVTENFVNKIEEITNEISKSLLEQNVDLVDQLTFRVEEGMKQYENSLNYLRELSEEYLLLDSTVTASATVIPGSPIDIDELNKTIRQSQDDIEERKEKVRKRKAEKNKKKNRS